jgi:hypothetical protein
MILKELMSRRSIVRPLAIAPNKKWAISPLISPPAGAHTILPGGHTRLHGQNSAKSVENQPLRRDGAAAAAMRLGGEAYFAGRGRFETV